MDHAVRMPPWSILSHTKKVMRDAIHNPETISFARAVVGTRLGWVLNVGGEEGIERLQAPARSVMVDFNSVSEKTLPVQTDCPALPVRPIVAVVDLVRNTALAQDLGEDEASNPSTDDSDLLAHD